MLDPHRTNGTSGATIFSRIFESSGEGISPELARYILAIWQSKARWALKQYSASSPRHA